MRRALAPLLAAILVLAIGVTSVSAAGTVQRLWRTSLGTAGANGSVHLTGYTDGTGVISLGLKSLTANALYYPSIWAGSCASPTKKIVAFRPKLTDASGQISGSVAISNLVMNNVWYYARPGTISFRIAYGRRVLCGNFVYNHATRVSIPSYKIDLPVVPGPNGYPYCNVAMYQRILWQPTEPGVTFIYAHARTGMFLPLLNASKINNGAAMIGKLVYVYTSNSMMYTYKIVQVRRHVTSIQSAIGVTSEHLWLQTSEGPNFSYPKLIVVADRIASSPASYAASHPTPHIVHCS